MVFHWILSDRKSSQVSWTFLSFLAGNNNAVVWRVSTCHLISMSSSPGTNPLLTVPRAPIIYGITVTFIFHNFLNSLEKPTYLSLFSLFSLLPSGTGTAKSTIRQVLLFCWLLQCIVHSGIYTFYFMSVIFFIQFICSSQFWIYFCPISRIYKTFTLFPSEGWDPP